MFENKYSIFFADQGAPGHSSGGAATMGSWPLDLKKVNVEIFQSSRWNKKGTPLYWHVVGSSIISYNFEVFSLGGNTNFPF